MCLFADLMSSVPPAVRRVIFGTHYRNVRQQKPTPINGEIEAALAKPKWSVKSMLPNEGEQEPTVSQAQLHHLLKLSALPLPKSADEEARMLKTLEAQIHFVKEIQGIDTTHVKPLVAIRDETAANVKEEMITLEKLQPCLDQEEKVGINGTIRRRKPTEMLKDSEWDPFELGEGKESRKKGRFFFVKKEAPKPAV